MYFFGKFPPLTVKRYTRYFGHIPSTKITCKCLYSVKHKDDIGYFGNVPTTKIALERSNPIKHRLHIRYIENILTT